MASRITIACQTALLEIALVKHRLHYIDIKNPSRHNRVEELTQRLQDAMELAAQYNFAGNEEARKKLKKTLYEAMKLAHQATELLRMTKEYAKEYYEVRLHYGHISTEINIAFQECPVEMNVTLVDI